MIAFAAALATAPAVTAPVHYLHAWPQQQAGVEAVADGAGRWCQSILTLQVVAREGSALFRREALLERLPQLKAVLDRDCPTATAAIVTVLRASDRGVVGEPLAIRKATGWRPAGSRAAPTATAQTKPPATPPAAPEAATTTETKAATAATNRASPRAPGESATVAPPSVPAPPARVDIASAPASAPAVTITAAAPVSNAPASPPSPSADRAPATAPTTAETRGAANPTAALGTTTGVPVAGPAIPPGAARTPPPAAAPPPVGYPGVMLVFLRANPELAKRTDVHEWWASYRYPEEYEKLFRHEFRLRPLVERAAADLARTLATPAPPVVLLAMDMRFGDYDFERGLFPVRFDRTRFELSATQRHHPASLPDWVHLEVRDLELLDGIRVAEERARAIIEKRTVRRTVNRDMRVVIEVELPAPGLIRDGERAVKAEATVREVRFYGDRNGIELLGTFAAADIDALRRQRDAAIAAQAAKEKAARDERERETRREAAARRERELEASREVYEAALATAPTEARLANFIAGDDIDPRRRLDDLRTARTRSLIDGTFVAVVMLVQADDDGRRDVATRWPGALSLNAGDDAPAFRDGGWYLVAGKLRVPDDRPADTATLRVDALHPCTLDQCADAADPAAIVERLLQAARTTDPGP